ncbi:MAG: bacteriocin family protein, partial [Anaerolineae bacterium]|nr:bacteriocin family protein [Anaerolineae bacterium]
QGVQVAQGSQYLDIVVARDITTAYRGPEGMDHRFRILESLAFPVKPASTSYVFSYEYTNVSPRRTL